MTSHIAIDTTHPPGEGARQVGARTPSLLLTETHGLCPGCGEPVALRILLEVLEQLGLAQNVIGVVGIGCYTLFSQSVDVEILQAMHGRAPSLATGLKRMCPETTVFTLQGDGDMVNEGLQEVMHTAARGERVTAVLLNNGVFGETGGQMTATTVLGQRTKNTLAGRDPSTDGYPIRLAEIVAGLDGVAYVARGAVHTPGAIARTRRMLQRAFESQVRREGFSLVEILTMCPTGWFVAAADGAEYMGNTLAETYGLGELKTLSSPLDEA
jgi:2-oxoglutarate ferredoxin oxidoreductase subunit beta